MFKVVNWDYKQLKENLPLLGAVHKLRHFFGGEGTVGEHIAPISSRDTTP